MTTLSTDPTPCPDCGGFGEIDADTGRGITHPDYEQQACSACGGEGSFPCERDAYLQGVDDARCSDAPDEVEIPDWPIDLQEIWGDGFARGLQMLAAERARRAA